MMCPMALATTETSDAMTVEEAAKRLGISRNTAYAAVRRAQLPALRIGRRYVIPIPMWEAFISGK